MKKLIAAMFIVILGTSFFIWSFKASLFQHLMSKQLNDVPVYLDELKIAENGITLEDFHIGNFPKSKTLTSLGSKKIAINMSLKKISQDPLIIDSLTLKDTLITIEYYNKSGSENNWESILKDIDCSKWSIKKGYLIKKISLERLTIQVTNYDGKMTKYPTIDKLEFYNISSDLGFPINKIDKAILNTILRSILSRLGLDNLLDQTNRNKAIMPHFSTGSTKESNSGVNPRADMP